MAWTGGLLPPPPANKPDTRVWQRAGLAWQQAPRTGMGAILTLDLDESRATRRQKRLRSKVTRGWLPTPSRFGGAPPFAVSDMPRGLTQDHQRLALPAEGGSRGQLGPPPSAPGPIEIILFYTVTPPRRDADDQGAGARFGTLQKLLASPTRWRFRWSGLAAEKKIGRQLCAGNARKLAALLGPP